MDKRLISRYDQLVQEHLHTGENLAAGLSYKTHRSKRDKVQITNRKDVRYDLQSSLLISDRTGQPIAPLVQNLVTSDHLLSTYREPITNPPSHLDELTDRIRWIDSLSLSKPIVHIVDREADSIAHLRAWKHTQYLETEVTEF